MLARIIVLVNVQALGGALTRHVLTAAGGALAAKGVITAALVEPFVGIGMAVFGFLWSLHEKRRR